MIEALWPGFVDLRAEPARARELSECHRFPILAEALIRLNAPNSSVWTSKVDVFVPEQIDPDELDAARDHAQSALACYIDCLPRNELACRELNEVESLCGQICDRLRTMVLRNCRVDLVIRGALISEERTGFGVTAYLTACGKNPDEAGVRLSECLEVFVKVLVPEP